MRPVRFTLDFLSNGQNCRKTCCAQLTFCLRPLLPVPVVRAELVETLDCDTDVGDNARAGIFGGGPGSAAGDLRCIERCEG